MSGEPMSVRGELLYEFAEGLDTLVYEVPGKVIVLTAPVMNMPAMVLAVRPKASFARMLTERWPPQLEMPQKEHFYCHVLWDEGGRRFYAYADTDRDLEDLVEQMNNERWAIIPRGRRPARAAGR